MDDSITKGGVSQPEVWVSFDDEWESRGYTPTPNCVLRDGSLSPEAKYMYGLLKSYAWEDPQSHPGIDRLCRAAGVSAPTLGKYLKEIDGKLIKIKRRGQGKTNLYRFLSLKGRYGPEINMGLDQEINMGLDQDQNPSLPKENPSNKTQERKPNRRRGEENPIPHCLEILGRVKGFPEDKWGNTAYLESLMADFPDVDPIDTCKSYEVWHKDNPNKTRNYRSRLRTFFKKRQEDSKKGARGPQTVNEGAQTANGEAKRRKEGYEWLFNK